MRTNGVCNSPDISQEKMNEMFCGIEFIKSYIDKILIITKGDWPNHLSKLELVLPKLRENRLKCNIENYCFGQTKTEYMGLWVTRTGIWPVNKKVEAIVNMMPPINKNRYVRS